MKVVQKAASKLAGWLINTFCPNYFVYGPGLSPLKMIERNVKEGENVATVSAMVLLSVLHENYFEEGNTLLSVEMSDVVLYDEEIGSWRVTVEKMPDE